MRIKDRETENKKIYELHCSEWKELDGRFAEKYKDEKYTYTYFYNLAEMFKDYSDYYVTDPKYYAEILPRLNPSGRTAAGVPVDNIFSDKNYFEKFFPDIKFPTAVIHCIDGNFYDNNYRLISYYEAVEKVSTYSELVFKKSTDTEHGAGIKLAKKNEMNELLKSFGNNFIVQELIKQHSYLSNYNSSSVNVIRIITVYWKHHCYVIDSRLRIGAPGSFCDHLGCGNVNPLEIGIAEDGSLKGQAFDEDGGNYFSDIFKKEIRGGIPSYQKLVDIALKGQAEYPKYGILGWDFTVDENGNPICIEVNSKWPSIRSAQCVDGPIFMKKTVDGKYLLDEIMAEPIHFDSMRIL